MTTSESVVRTTARTEAPPRFVAVIDIGATSIRMEVAEIHSNGEIRTLDTLVQAVDLGREAFEFRRLSRKSIEKASQILKRYRRILREYGITATSDIRVVATSAVREAINRVAFIDRVYVATGFDIETIDEAEVNRITYMGITPHLQVHPELENGKTVVVEVGGGSTELLVVRSGNVLHSESYRLGSLRLVQTVEPVRGSVVRKRTLLESHIRRTLVRVTEQIRTDMTIHLIAIGGDMRFAAHRILEDWDGVSLAELPTDQLAELTDEILLCDEDAIVKNMEQVSSKRERSGLRSSPTPCLPNISRFRTFTFATRTYETACFVIWQLVELGQPSFATRSFERQFLWGGSLILMKRMREMLLSFVVSCLKSCKPNISWIIAMKCYCTSPRFCMKSECSLTFEATTSMHCT